MRIDYCGEETIDDASLEQVMDRFDNLKKEADSFLIVIRDDQVYLQTCWMEDGMYVEYREGDAAQHFVSAEENLNPEIVRKMFQQYFEGGDGFKQLAAFEQWNPYRRKGCMALILCAPLFYVLI